MRNYIILNNQNSNEISGLIIQELAPISKPLQRTQVETIDGRDGDIVTPLGYAAYNKKIKIGLYGNFDINEVIAYFATKGTVIFSNEPDKYYYYQIVDQIDYERLVRYRVATVTMHVQPFKYSATEGTITVDSSDTVSGEGSNIALDGTAEAPFNVLRHKGNATQKTIDPLNLFNVYDTDGGQVTDVSVDADGWLTCTINNTSGTNTKYGLYFTNNLAGLQTSTTYAIVMEVKAKSGTGTVYPTQGSGAQSQMSANKSYSFNDIAAGQTYIFTQATKADFTGTNQGLRSVVAFAAGQSGSITFRLSVLADTSVTPSTFAYLPFVGSSSSPNTDYPQGIQVVTGDQTIKIMGKNLFDNTITPPVKSNYTSITYTPSSTRVTLTNTPTQTRYAVYPVMPLSALVGKTITFSVGNIRSVDASPRIRLVYCDSTGNNRETITDYTTGNHSYSIVIPDTRADQWIGLTMYGTTTTSGALKDGYSEYENIQVEISDTATQFETHKEQSYVIPFSNTYLAKIGDYADEPVKVDGTWYIRRAIGKVIFDGSDDEYWTVQSTGTNSFFYWTRYFYYLTSDTSAAISDTFTRKNVTTVNTDIGVFCLINSNQIRFRPNFAELSLADWRTWLSTHNVTVYYALNTPTDEAITDQDLIDALDEFFGQAHAYKAGTFITATPTSGNAPAVLSVDVNEDNESTVTNAGNTTSRPILTIYGQGDIGVYINDVEVLDVALGDEEYITLDSVEMEAYKDTTANLKNRLVTGDYSKLALNAGANKIRFTGIVTKYEISKYSRWL